MDQISPWKNRLNGLNTSKPCRRTGIMVNSGEFSGLESELGIFTGRYALHPFTEEKIPIWIADYVLAGYGTGIVMGVPAHDQRDFLFAKKYGLSIKTVILPQNQTSEPLTQAYEEPGIMVNSGEFSGQ